MSPPPNVDRGTTLEAVTWPFVAVAFVFIVLRFWARLYKRAVSIDDGLMLFSWLLFLSSAIIFHFVAASGGTRHIEYMNLAEIEHLLKLLNISLPFAIAATGIGKLAIGVTILRIFGNTSRWRKWAVWSIMIILTTVSTIDIFIGLFRCGHPQALWDFAMMATAKCLPTTSYDSFNIFVIAVQTCTDYLFSILPMLAVWRLKMNLRRRLTVIFLLGLTLITAVTATVKLVLQVNLSTADITWTQLPIDICFSVEAMFIIVFGSVPVLHPLWEAYKQAKLSSGITKLIGSPKQLSSPSHIYQQQSPIETAAQEATCLQSGDLELARLGKPIATEYQNA